MNFNSLLSNKKIENKKEIEKIYFNLLAYGISDFTEANKIWEKLKKSQSKLDTRINNSSLDLIVYEYLSQKSINSNEFGAKQILSLTCLDSPADSTNALEKLEKIFPQNLNVSSMTPSPIHFGPLEGFFSDSNSAVDVKTLILTIGFWFFIYTLIIYNLYF
ncbi:MAG: hypothetical protein KA146_06765 [Leptospiraceae bacterium]|nr:hypothetical protein [Leptospiraceae bacterium]